MTTHRFCTECGSGLEGAARFCADCGAPVSAPAPAPEPAATATLVAERPPVAAAPPVVPAPPVAPPKPPSVGELLRRLKPGRRGWIALGVLALLGAGGAYVAKVYDPSDRALEADAERALKRLAAGQGTDDVRYADRLLGFSATSALTPKGRLVSADAHLKAVDDDRARVELDARYAVTPTVSEGWGRTLTAFGREQARMRAHVTMGLRKVPGEGWVPQWVGSRDRELEAARPATEGDTSQPEQLAGRAIEELLTIKGGESQEAWTARQAPFYAVGPLTDSESYGDDVKSGTPWILLDGDSADGPAPEVLKAMWLGDHDGEIDEEDGIDLGTVEASAAPAKVVRASAMPTKSNALFQHAEVEGRVRVSADGFESCYPEFDDEQPSSTAAGIVAWKAEMVRSRLAGDSRWYVARLAFDVEGRTVEAVTSPFDTELTEPTADTDQWVGAEDQGTAGCY